MNKFSWQTMMAIALALFVGVLLGRITPNQTPDTTNTSQPKSPQAAMTVQAITPSLERVSDEIDASGVIVGKDVAKVGARISGAAVEQIFVQEGDTVTQGQVLAQLDDTTSKSQLDATQAELAQAQSALKKAQADLMRVEPLVAIDAISRQQYDGFVTAKDQALAQVTAVQARVDNAQTALGHTQVVAPVAGVISARHAQVGELVTTMPLFEIVKDGDWQWQASIPPSLADQISIGQQVLLSVPNQSLPLSATVNRIAPTTDAGRNLSVFATLGDTQAVVGGMYVAGRFLLTEQSKLTLPYQAVTISDGFGYVWRLTPSTNGLYQVQKQQVSASVIGERVVVDLPPTALIVKQGGNFLKDGDLVRVTDNAQATTAGVESRP